MKKVCKHNRAASSILFNATLGNQGMNNFKNEKEIIENNFFQ